MQTSAALALLLQRIDRNPGILPVKEGQALIRNDKWTLIKILDLSLFCNDLDYNINRYVSLNNHVFNNSKNKYITSEISDIKTQTDYIRNLTIEKINQLLPPKRVKRGILNPLGSIIKLISGNLDNDDAIRYDTLIRDTQTKQNVIDKKVTVITEMLETLVDITNSTKYNFIELDKAIWNIRKQLNATSITQSAIKIYNVYNLFLHNFQILYAKLDEVETVVAFSKLGMLHQAIIDTNELLPMLQNIEKRNKLVFTADIENIVKLQQCIDLKVYIKENQITFILDIPLVDNDVYTYYKVLPLPMTNFRNLTSLILPKFPYLLAKGLKTVSIHHPCKEVDELLFLCEEDITPSLVKDVCVSNLIRFAEDTSQCSPIEVDIENVKVERIQLDRWIIYTRSSLILTQSCKEETTYHHIQGTYILTADDDCEADIKGIKLKKHQGSTQEMQLSTLPIISLPEVSPLPTKLSPGTRPINLDEIELSNLQHLASMLSKSESVSDNPSENHNFVNAKDVSIGTILLYVILILVIAFYTRKYIVFRNSRVHGSSPDNFEVREGEVMHPSTDNNNSQFLVISAQTAN